MNLLEVVWGIIILALGAILFLAMFYGGPPNDRPR